MGISQGDAEALTTAYTAAWNMGSPEAVAGSYALDGRIIINGGIPWQGRARVSDMAAGFYRDVAALALKCDAVRRDGDHIVFMWTFTGQDATTGNSLLIEGWEEWDLDSNGKVKASLGWFDANDYARQTSGG